MITTFKEEPITTVTLKDLAGAHALNGVDLTNDKIKAWYDKDVYEDAQCFSFRLDEKTYTAIEDPSDGYRSSMQEIRVSDHALKNTFPVLAAWVIRGPILAVSRFECQDLRMDEQVLPMGCSYRTWWAIHFRRDCWEIRIVVPAAQDGRKRTAAVEMSPLRQDRPVLH